MTPSKLIVITGAGASTALGRGVPLPMMGEWCDRIMDDLDQQSLGLAAAIGLRRGMQGDEFERALGKFLQWHRTLPLAEDFARLGESDPLGEVNPIVKEWLSQSLERLPIVVEIINRSLWREFGLERIDDDAALSAYGSLCDAVQATPGGDVALFSATTNYDRSGEGGWTGPGFRVDDGARESRPGGSRFLEVDGVVPWADSGTIPHLHLHGAVGWYKQSNRILVEPADREFEPRWVPAVLYPDPNKDPYGDSGVGVDALWSCFERALAQATHALVLGHSLHDRPLLAALARRLTGPPIRIAISYYGDNTSAARPIVEQLASTPLVEEDVDLSLLRVAFGPDPQLDEVREWMAGEQVRVRIHDEEAAEPPAAVSQPAQVLGGVPVPV